MAESRRSSVAFRVLFGAALLLLAGLSVGYRYLPLVDWPEHCKMAAIRSHLHEPAFGFATYFEKTGWFLPYQTFRWTQILLGRLLGDRIGFAVALWPYLVGVPTLLLLLLRRLERDLWSVFIGCGILVESNLLWGFAPYLTGIVVLLLGLVCTLDFLRGGGRLRGSLLVGVGVLAFFTHPESALLYFGSAGVFATAAVWQGATTMRRAGWVMLAALPGGVMVVFYLVGAGWVSSTSATVEFYQAAPTVFRSPIEVLRNLPHDSGLNVLGPLPAILFLVATATAMALGQRQLVANPWRRAMSWVVAAWVLLLFAAPASVRGEPVGVRLSSGFLLLTTLVLPSAHDFRRWPARGVWVVGGLTSILWAHRAFASYDRSLRPLDAIIKQIPVRAKVATMAYEVDPPGIAMPSYVHFGGYITTVRGGLPAFTFQVGIQLKQSVPRTCMLVADDWRPYYGWQIENEKAACWDYLVVLRGKAFPGSPFADPTVRRRLLLEEGSFQLWDLHP